MAGNPHDFGVTVCIHSRIARTRSAENRSSPVLDPIFDMRHCGSIDAAESVSPGGVRVIVLPSQVLTDTNADKRGRHCEKSDPAEPVMNAVSSVQGCGPISMRLSGRCCFRDCLASLARCLR